MIHRIHKTKDYTVMSNHHFRERDMSLKAKGLLSLVLSLPDDWDYSIDGLVALSKDGRDSVRNTLKELEKFRYLVRTQATNSAGQFTKYEYDVYEKPCVGKPASGNPTTVNPTSEKHTQLNTKELNTKELNTNNIKAKSEKPNINRILTDYTDNKETLELLNEWLKARKSKRVISTESSIRLNLEKLDKIAEASGLTVNDYLKEIICRGWAAFYEIPQYGNKPVVKKESEPIQDDDMDELYRYFTEGE